MKDNNLNILKQFARKLSNCKYRVSVNSLIDYFNDGKFGFSYKKGASEVVTNDYIFADDINTAIKHIRNIFKEPHISIKQDEIISLSSIATKIDARSLNETIKDEKLWKVRGNSIKPEYVHAYVNEENLAIYENRFICYLIDTLQTACAQKISALCKNLTTLNQVICASSEDGDNFSFNDYDNFVNANGEIPKLLTSNEPIVAVISSLIKSRNSLEILKSDKLYFACKKAGKFDGSSPKSTNIFENEANYNYCYNFYVNYFNKDVTIGTEEDMYNNFVKVSMFTAINNLGYTPSFDNESISVNNSAQIKFDKVCFTKTPFSITVSQKDNDLELEIVNEVDGNSAKCLVLINPKANKVNDEDGLLYTNVLTVLDKESDQENVYTVMPSKNDTLDKLTSLIKSLLIIVEGSEFIHTMYCPVCGSPLIAPDYKDYTCTKCECVYHIFNYEYKDLIWIKRAPKLIKKQNNAISDLSEVSESLVVSDALGVDFKNFVSKSFTEKLDLTTGNQKDFYAEIKEYILTYKKARSRVSFSYDNFFYGRNSVAKITVRGKTLSLYLALSPSEFMDTKYSPKDATNVKKYEDTPMLVKVKSTRGVKFAKELIDILFSRLGAVKMKIIPKDNQSINIEEENSETNGINFGNFVSKSFTEKLELTDKNQKEFYNDIKEYILSFKKSRSRISFSYDNFFFGRKSIAKVVVRGKTLCMYLALDPKEYMDTKYFPRDFGHVKKYEDTPMLIKIKSSRGVKFAKELIDILFSKLNQN